LNLAKAVKCSKNTSAEGILGEINSILMLAEIHNFNQYLNSTLPLKDKIDVLLQIFTQVKLLLILDNYESILNNKRRIADPQVAALLNHLLNGLSAKSKMIITSRWEFDPLEGRLQDQIIRINLPEFILLHRPPVNEPLRLAG
jgi:F0F1-type ATP synthase delta subunit